MTVPDLAPFASTAALSASCAWYCISRSSVVCRLVPSIGSFTTSMPCAMGWPALCSNVRSPGTPASSESYSASSPASPVPSMPTNPITAGASAPAG